MEANTATTKYISDTYPRILQAVGPVLVITLGYIDPGKWAAVVDGGARFGFDLLSLILVFNCAAILCHYLAARISVVTGKNLAQICNEEYNMSTCLCLGVQAEVSAIVLDLTMILGIAHGLNLLLGVDLCTCVLLTAIDIFLFPLLTSLLGKCKERVLFVSSAGLILIFYMLGVLTSQPEVPLVMNGMLTRLSGGTAFTLMSLLGANVMPHNFYLHSSIVQQQQQQQQGSPPNTSKTSLCHDHFLAIVCIFSGIYLVNFVLMSSAAQFFHSADLIVLTFQDALLLIDQVFRSPVAPIAFFLLLFISNEIIALTWNYGGQVLLNDFFRLDTPAWFHRTTIRVLAVFPALYCTSNSGAEGMYHLLIFSQVILAMLLPSSVIPLVRVASSRSIMGALKMSQSVEFLALTTFMGMLGLKIFFVVEMLFGDGEWVGNMRWVIGSSRAFPYAVLLITACASLAFMVVLAITPLNSEGAPDEPTLYWDMQRKLPEQFAEGEEKDETKIRCHVEDPVEQELGLEKSEKSFSDNSVVEFDFDIHETVIDSDPEPHLPVQDIHTTNQVSTRTEMPTSAVPQVQSLDKDVSDVGSLEDVTLEKVGLVHPVSKAKRETRELRTDKNDDENDEGDTGEPEEASKGIPRNGPTSTLDCPGSFRSLSGKSEEGNNGSGSLSRLCGLGRAARRQLAANLDEFWGQLYDFHGQATQEAKARKYDILLGVDPALTSSLNVCSAGMQCSGYFQSVADIGHSLPANSNMYDYPKQQMMPGNIETSFGIQSGFPSLWDPPILDAYAKSSTPTVHDPGEKSYSSLHLPPFSGGFDYQPATIHGYQVASYLSSIAAERNSESLDTYLDLPALISPSLSPANHMDELNYALLTKPQNGVYSSQHVSNMQNPLISNRLYDEQSAYNPLMSGHGANAGSQTSTKKYRTLSDISSLAVPHQQSYAADRSTQRGSPPGFGTNNARKAYEQSLLSDIGSMGGVTSLFSELTPSIPYGDTFPAQMNMSVDAKSLWSRQPCEQLFGVAGKFHSMGNGIGSRSVLGMPEVHSRLELEVNLLQSLRHCLAKLLKLEGSDWLFSLNGGTDEDLIDRLAARERFYSRGETKEINEVALKCEPQYLSSERRFGSMLTSEEIGPARLPFSLISNCGEGCIWRADLVVSFGVWCIRRILELSLMESRPELWGKYTYVLNRLQGIIEPAFFKPRSPLPPCPCLQVPAPQTKKSNLPMHSCLLPPAAKPGRGKCTSASTVLDLIKDVEIAVSCRKGRTGTVAGDVAFPKGKENLASVLKRYKRRLSNKTVGNHEGGGRGSSFRK